MKPRLFVSVLCFIFCAALASAEIQVRVDENGKKVFYNSPEKIQRQVTVNPGQTLSKRAEQFAPLIEKACNKYQVDPELVKAVIQVESAYNSRAQSHAGAIGLMQLMPATASRFGVKEIHDPQENIHGGVQYLKFLLKLFNDDLTLTVAAYNAGEGAVQKYRGVPKYTETQNYVKRVLSLYGKDDVPAFSMVTAKTIYRYADAQGAIHFTTERPKAAAFTEIKMASL